MVLRGAVVGTNRQMGYKRYVGNSSQVEETGVHVRAWTNHGYSQMYTIISNDLLREVNAKDLQYKRRMKKYYVNEKYL